MGTAPASIQAHITHPAAACQRSCAPSPTYAMVNVGPTTADPALVVMDKEGGGAPPGGEYRMVKYVGCCTMFVGLVLFIPTCCCPCDSKEHYIAPDGTHYMPTGAVDDKYGPCSCC